MDASSANWDNVLDSDSVSISLDNGRRADFWSTFILVSLFGIGSWIAVNGLYVELPVLVNHTPEGIFLPSYITVICQLANVGPLIFAALRKISPRVNERSAIYVIVSFGVCACLGLCFFWNRTSNMFGKERSTALILFTFAVAVVDCTSTVTFLPFMAMLPPTYMSALYTGENMSGLLAGLVALVQGVEKPHHNASGTAHATRSPPSSSYPGMRFSVEWFFGFLTMMMVICLVAYIAINFLPSAKRQHVLRKNDYVRQGCIVDRYQRSSSTDSIMRRDSDTDDNYFNPVHSRGSENSPSPRQLLFLLVIQAWINALSNGVISQISSFACLPYGSIVFHLSVTLSSVASAVTSFAFMWCSTKSRLAISLWSSLYTLCGLYILILALESPQPILLHEKVGKVLVVIINVLGAVCVSYAKLAICSVMREAGQKYLFWCGISIQLGSFVGAGITFPIVTFSGLFQ